MHVIRIHGPWTAEMGFEGRKESRRVHLPRDWEELGRLAATVSILLIRRFHRPTGLGPSTQVAISVPREWPLEQVTLDGQPLAAALSTSDRQHFDISLAIRNLESHDLEIRFPKGVDLQSQPYSVTLEIEDPADSPGR